MSIPACLTSRNAGGFWRAYPALAAARLSFEEIANPTHFRPRSGAGLGLRCGHRLALYRSTLPHAGFALLQAWAELMEHGVFVSTSNVDGQFQKSGFPADRVCEGARLDPSLRNAVLLRGHLARTTSPEVDAAACRLRNEVPRCPSCGLWRGRIS